MRRLLVVDDHAGFRSWACEVLAQEGFEVVGVAGDGRTAISLAHELQPDVVLVDIQLPDLDGLEVADQIADAIAVVLTSGRAPEEYGQRLASSAHAFVPKHELSGQVLSAMLGESR